MNPFCSRVKDLVQISQTTGPNMTALHCANDLCKGICMYGIVHLLVLQSFILDSEIFFTFYIYFLYFSTILYFFSTANIHDIQRAN